MGSVEFTEGWQLAQPGSTTQLTKGYTLDLAAYWNHIPTTLKATFTTADLAQVNSRYYTDDRTLTSAFVRLASYPDSGSSGIFQPFMTPVARTEYVGALGGGGVSWLESELLNNNNFDNDPGFLDGPTRTIPAGSISATSWARGPLGAGIPVQDDAAFAYCYACRTSTSMELDQAPWLDSDPTHTGELFSETSGAPVARFRLYRNGTLIDDQDDYLGDVVTVPAAAGTYQAQLDVDRRQQTSTQSTRSTTILGFTSASGQGAKLPSATWYYLADDATTCRVLPILQARAMLPTSLNGTLPAGKSSISVLAQRIQGAATSTVTSATLAIRASGTTAWTTVPLASGGAGSYLGTLDNSTLAGQSIDIKVTAADAGGSTYQQTVLKAYTVAAS